MKFAGLCIFLCASPAFAQHAIDGLFDDWDESHVIATDATADATGTFDLTAVSASTNGTLLNLRLVFEDVVQLQNGAASEGTIRLELETDRGAMHTIDLRNRSRTVTTVNSLDLPPKIESPPNWAGIGFACSPTYSAKEFELQLDLARLTNSESGHVKLSVAGSDQIDEPVTIQFDGESREQFAATNTLPRTVLRVANLNTMKNGLSDPKRQPGFKRILRRTLAYYFCFQEEWDEAKFNDGIEAVFDEDTKSVWSGGCAIVATGGYSLTPIPMTLDRAVAAVIDAPSEARTVVISAHFKCCGYDGSSEDSLRIQQAKQIAGEIGRMREGAFGDDLKEAHVIVVGDYTLVGSRTPMDELAKAGLVDHVFKCVEDGAAYTWRGLEKDQSFWPGRLDVMMHSGGLKPGNFKVVDTERMSDKKLEVLDLNRDDSRVSDHLMLVGEFLWDSSGSSK